MRSSNEIYSLMLKACRGQNIPLGQAQYVAAAATAQPQALADFVHHLNMPQKPFHITAPPHVKIENAHILRDIPTIIAALAAGVDRITAVGVTHDQAVAALLSQSHQNIIATQSQAGLTLSCTAGENTPAAPSRADVDPQIWQQLSDMAAKIYVPETEASRSGGAGAGLTDND